MPRKKKEKKQSKKQTSSSQLKFLSQSVYVEESPSPYIISTTMGVISLILLAFLAWAAITNVDEVARADGQVIPNGYLQAVQHPEGGVISEIHVEEGDFVKAGDLLLVLDDGNLRSDAQRNNIKARSLALEAARLRAFIYDQKPNFSKIAGDLEHLADDEYTLLESMESARSKKRIVLEDKIAQHTQEMKRLKDNIVNQRENVRIIEKENAIRQDLVQKGISSQIVALESQRRLNEARGELKTSQNRVKEAEKQIAESRSRLESLDADLHEAALKELGQVETELAEIDETQSKMRLNLDRMEIRAPTRGLVKGLSTHTIGGVVGSGQLLMEIVPMRQELFVEAKIQPKDVGHIEIGQNVKVKVSSFDFARYGAVEGTITQISPATYSDEEGEVYYKGRISLTKHYVGDDPKRNFILPGMTVQADIKTGEKTVIAYLLKPIQIAREQAFSER